MSEGERELLQKHADEYTYTYIVQGKKVLKKASELTTRRVRYSYNPDNGPIEKIELPLWFFEEDCDWAYLELYTGVHCEGVQEFTTEELRTFIARDTERKERFDRFMKRKADKDPNLVVSALRCESDKSLTKIATADGKYHIVSDYSNRDPMKDNTLDCYTIVESDVKPFYT